MGKDIKNKRSMFGQLVHVYLREFRNVFRDEGLVLFFLFLPLAYPVIYSLIYNPELVRDVPMVVVDHDRTALSREFVRNLDATQEIYVKGYAAEMGEARRAMAGRDCFAIMEIPEGFARHAGRQEAATPVLYTDMTLMLRYKAFLMGATNVAQEMGSELQSEALQTDLPVSVGLSGDPLPVHNISLGNIQGGFDSFVMPGVVVLILQQCLILAIGMAGGNCREDKRMLGYNPINEQPSVLMTMTGKLLCYSTIMIFPILYLIHYIPMMFSFPMEGDPVQIFAFLTPMVISSMCIGFCLQAIVRERETIFIIWVVTSVVFLFLSGLTWPRFAMPEVWKLMGDIVPATWGVEGFIRMNTNGSSLSQVAPCYHALWILTGVYFVAAYLLHRFVIRPRLGLPFTRATKP